MTRADTFKAKATKLMPNQASKSKAYSYFYSKPSGIKAAKKRQKGKEHMHAKQSCDHQRPSQGRSGAYGRRGPIKLAAALGRVRLVEEYDARALGALVAHQPRQLRPVGADKRRLGEVEQQRALRRASYELRRSRSKIVRHGNGGGREEQLRGWRHQRGVFDLLWDETVHLDCEFRRHLFGARVERAEAERERRAEAHAAKRDLSREGEPARLRVGGQRRVGGRHAEQPVGDQLERELLEVGHAVPPASQTGGATYPRRRRLHFKTGDAHELTTPPHGCERRVRHDCRTMRWPYSVRRVNSKARQQAVS
eukprot:5708780-Pleurochrysis_carterae.AAC.5